MKRLIYKKKSLIFILGFFLAFFNLRSLVLASSERERELAYILSFKEAEVLLAQRVKPWKKEKERAEDKNNLWQIGGYYKNLLNFTKTIDTEENFFLDLERLRLENRLAINSVLEANLTLDQEIIIGDSSHTSAFDAIRNKDQKKLAFIDTDRVYTDRDHIYAKYSLYRAYLKYYKPDFQVAAGKQLLDWGRCRFFSPMDLFNPASPLETEKEERLGIDAINTEYSLNSLSSLNLVYAPQYTLEKSSFGSRLYHQAGNYDLFFVLGEFKKDEVIGWCFDGYLGNGGVRGEFTQTHSDSGRNFFRAVTGAEYNFSNKFYILGEYFYNGGAEDNERTAFLNSYEFSSKAFTQKKNLFGLWLKYEITPLVKWENFLLYDLDDKSNFFNPELKYNLWANLDLTLGAQLFWGNSDSEFGDYQNLYYTQMQYFF